VFFAIVFVAESVPNFGPLLDLFGASAMTTSSMILPGLFNLYLIVGLQKADGKINTDHRATLREYEL
jgi:hypothetical protein